MRVSAWLMIRQKRGTSPDPLLALVQEAMAAEPPEDPTAAPPLWQLFQELPATRDQELAADLLTEIYGDDWLDQASANLQHAAPGMVRVLIEKLASAGRKQDLIEHYTTLLGRPLRAPHALVTLARMVETGKLKGELPPPVQRAQALLTLATHLWAERRADVHMGRAHTRLVELLAGGKQPVLEKLLDGADARSLRSAQLLIQRGVEESIDNIVASLVFHSGPTATGGAAARFWESPDTIWTTRSGLQRRRAELREIRDVKMPENEDAIGRAAALGDISENAEWESAIEEKRNLSSRVAQMEAELRQAALLENTSLPDDTVSPGTTVRYRDVGSGEESTVVILGPWDMDRDERVVSYRAPLAQGLLGMHTGEKRTITLPSGPIEVELLAVEPAEID
jgi:transcription elongation factor GreA